ncbi:O-antigen ligase family protein, partial [bacterium]|nr:O-antigen ligase family protein [bacterium]
MKKFNIATLFIFLFFILMFFLNIKIAFTVLFLGGFFIFTFYNIKFAFYLFLFSLPLSFNVHLGMMGIHDIFIADALFLIIILIFFIKKILRREFEIKFTPLTYYILFFIIISILSIIFAKYSLEKNELYRINSILHIKYAVLSKQSVYSPGMGNIILFLRTLYPILLFLFVSETFKTREDIKTVLKIILASGIVAMAYGYLLKFHMIPESIYSVYTGYYLKAPIVRITSTFENPQAFGSFVAIILSILFYYNIQRKEDIFLWFLTFAFLFIFIFTYSLGAFFALLVSLSFIVIYHYKSSGLGKTLILLLSILLISFVFLKNDIIFAKIHSSMTMVNPHKHFPSTFQARIIQWARWFKILKNHYLLGLGYPLVWTDNNYLKLIVNAGIL